MNTCHKYQHEYLVVILILKHILLDQNENHNLTQTKLYKQYHDFELVERLVLNMVQETESDELVMVDYNYMDNYLRNNFVDLVILY